MAFWLAGGFRMNAHPMVSAFQAALSSVSVYAEARRAHGIFDASCNMFSASCWNAFKKYGRFWCALWLPVFARHPQLSVLFMGMVA